MARHSGIRNLRQGQVDAIIRCFLKGLTSRQVSEIQGVSIRCVQRIWKKYKDTGSVGVKKHPGAARTTSRLVGRNIVRLARNDPRLSAAKILREISALEGPNPSSSTVKRRLREAGLFGRRPVKKPLISAKNCKVRLDWAQAQKNWTVQQWRKVIWSDESKFLLLGTDGIKFVRRPVDTRYHPSCQLPTVKGGGGSVMVRGSSCGKGVGPLHRTEGKVDAKMYLNIMKTVIWPFVRSTARSGFIFQQDNDPKHKSKLLTKWFSDNNVPLLTWPSQSPDLNPIEHLWERLEHQVKGLRARNEGEKFLQLKTAWENIPQEEIDKLIESIPRRCQAVIDARGYATKY
uniref:Transposable element Tcb1 transposase n=1 Tax=Haemonchus contortus TaxID=6289 RepID=A0A7I4YB81_HAECO